MTGSGALAAPVLTAAVERLRAQVPAAAGASVALRQPDSFRAALWLAALDGLAGSLLLLPPGLDDSTADGFLTAVDCRMVIDSDPLPALLETGAATETEARHETRWIIPTSGTTGTPKLVGHTFATLSRSAQRDKARGAGYCWGLLYDITRFAGLQVFLQAVCGGSSLVLPPASADLSEQIKALATAGCNALSATPTLWRKLLMLPEAAALPLKSISMGGEIADRRVLEAVAAAWPEAKVRHIYASTEAGVGFSVTDGLPGFPAAFLANPPPGVELKVDHRGMLWLRPAVQGQEYVTGGLALAAEDGWIVSGDIVRAERDRYLFCGRENGAINVGGNKVFPQEVEAVILSVPGVAAAVVSGRANPVTGQLVEAQVVAEPGADAAALRRSIMETCRGRLERWQVPAVVKFVEAIAVTAAGKAARS